MRKLSENQRMILQLRLKLLDSSRMQQHLLACSAFLESWRRFVMLLSTAVPSQLLLIDHPLTSVLQAMNECDAQLRMAAASSSSGSGKKKEEEQISSSAANALDKLAEVSTIMKMICELLGELLPAVSNQQASFERILANALKFLKLHVKIGKMIAGLHRDYPLPRSFFALSSALKTGLSTALRKRLLAVSY
jgi:hypothetical protein